MSRKRLFLHAAWPLAAFLLSAPAFAQDVRQELEETQAHMQESTARNKTLGEQYTKLLTELSSRQTAMVTLASQIQQHESSLSAMEDKQKKLETENGQKTAALKTQQEKLAGITQALLRLSQTPEEAVIAMPGDYANMIRTARVLGLATASVRNEALQLQSQVSELSQLRQKIDAGRFKLVSEKASLETRRRVLDNQMKDRKKTQVQLASARQKEAANLSELSKKSSNLQDLIRSIEIRESSKQAPMTRQTPQQIAAPGENAAPHKPLRSFVAAKGTIKLPAEGHVTGMFGTARNRNETYKGIALATRDNAQVTAPYDGEVVFAGPFLAYGRIIIIRHSDEFHTLLAGLHRIDCAPGQFLLEGEPVGVMGTKEEGETGLYIELRQQNRPVDPTPWIAGIAVASRE